MSLLEIRGLKTHIHGPAGTAMAVDGVDLDIREGEAVGLVGESGSGKTLLALSIMGLLPDRGGRIVPGSSIRLRGEELVGISRGRLRQIRGGEVAMIFQEPMTSLNPVFSVGSQIGEVLRLHRGLRGGAVREEVVKILGEVGIPDPGTSTDSFPHQLSGGMRQRVMVGMALAGEPVLLVADEPTTALDVTVEAQILSLLKQVQANRHMGLLLISHDLSVVSRVCDRVVVLYGGRVVESGPLPSVLQTPQHPYTQGLVGSNLTFRDSPGSLRPIPGEVPEATAWPPGCRFHPRCSATLPRCHRENPVLRHFETSSEGPSAEGGIRQAHWEVACWNPVGRSRS